MIRREDFQIRIEYDSHGPLVIVNHPISGIERRARPSSLESVGKVKERLLAEITSEFCDPADLIIEHGHSRRDGKITGFVRAVHLLTGISAGRELGAATKPSQAQFEALDEVIAQLWQQKVESKP